MEQIKVSKTTAELVKILRQLHEVEGKVLEYGDEEKTVEAFRYSEDRVMEILMENIHASLADSIFTEL